jgi:hypothetical protein
MNAYDFWMHVLGSFLGTVAGLLFLMLMIKVDDWRRLRHDKRNWKS